MVIQNCTITGGTDAKILKHFCIDRKSDYYRLYGKLNPSVTLESKNGEVCNQFSGRVMSVTFDNNRYSVVVQTDSNNCMKYSNMNTCIVRKGDDLSKGQKIGGCKKSVVVEYANNDENNYPIRIVLHSLLVKMNDDRLCERIASSKFGLNIFNNGRLFIIDKE